MLKDHRNYSHFLEEGKGQPQLFDYAAEIGIGNLEIPPKNMDELQQPFWFVYNSANFKSRHWRLLCGIFYAIGFCLIVWVLLENLLTVLQLVFTQ